MAAHGSTAGGPAMKKGESAGIAASASSEPGSSSSTA
jgi:hypothetical protein